MEVKEVNHLLSPIKTPENMKQITLLKPYQFEEKDVKIPHLKKGELLVQIKNIGICGTDIHAFHGNQPYFTYPRVLGHELSGIIVDTKFENKSLLGKPVSVLPYLSCGKCNSCLRGKTNCCANLNVMGVHVDGGFREYLSVPEDNILVGKNETNLEHLSMVEPLSISYHGILRAEILENDWVIVFGAGPIGIGALMFAKSKTNKIILIDINQNRIDYCKSNLGIEHSFHGNDESLIKNIRELTNGHFADIVIDATGNKNSIQQQLTFLGHGGKWILIGLQREDLHINHPEFHKREATLMSSRNATKHDFEQVMEMIDKKEIDPDLLITHTLDFKEVARSFSTLIVDPTLIKGIIKVNGLEKQ
jgi:2-desacetyl-2-hydroxyethyl bacteriochlorophyllide A dehydrogenase